MEQGDTRPSALPDSDLVDAARRGDPLAFERVVANHRRELYAHCYRMLGSVQDAEDALQEALIGAWRGLPAFQGRSSLRSWLYRVSTNACLRQIAKQPRRLLSQGHNAPRHDTGDLGQPVTEAVWLEPWLDDEPAPEADPASRYLKRESVELAFVAALQHLPGTQRAVLILREVLEFSAAEVANILDTTPASVNSALQRARKAVDQRTPATSQQVELDALGSEEQRKLIDAFVSAWERADIAALLDLLTEDAQLAMPPLPAWFQGRVDVGRFFAERVFTLHWRLLPIEVNGQLGLACYTRESDRWKLSSVTVLGVRGGRVADIVSFLDPPARFGLVRELSDESFARTDEFRGSGVS